jgi:hypothetical protein
MNIRYLVHSASVEKIQQSVTLAGGQKVDALVDGMTVELVEIDGTDTLTRRFVPADMKAAQALFKTGAVVVATLAAEKAK